MLQEAMVHRAGQASTGDSAAADPITTEVIRHLSLIHI